MNQVNRRRVFLRAISRLPIVAGAIQLGLFGLKDPFKSEREADQQINDRRLHGINIIRLINTLQRWNFDQSSHYVELGAFDSLDATKLLLNDAAAEKAGIGSTLYHSLDFGSKEIVRGWQIYFRLRRDATGYVVAIRDVSGLSEAAFASDQKAVIHTGSGINDFENSSDWDSAELIRESKPIETSTSRRFIATVSTLVFGPNSVLAECCVQVKCPCAGSCQEGYVTGCRNCGCSCCVWCCSPY